MACHPSPWPSASGAHCQVHMRPANHAIGTGEGKTLLEYLMLELRNRQLEDVLQGLGLPVKQVSCVGIGPLRLKGLGCGLSGASRPGPRLDAAQVGQAWRKPAANAKEVSAGGVGKAGRPGYPGPARVDRPRKPG